MRSETDPSRREPGKARTCVGCRTRITGADLERSFRVVQGPADPGGRHEVAVDLAGGSFGRGAHVHATRACVAKACAGGFARAFRCQVAAREETLANAVALSVDRRVEGLLLGARRAGLLAFGEEAKRAVEEGAPLVLVARDAGASALGGPLRQAVADGRVVPFRTKAELGRLFSRELVAVVAVRHAAVAREIESTVRLLSGLVEIVTGS